MTKVFPKSLFLLTPLKCTCPLLYSGCLRENQLKQLEQFNKYWSSRNSPGNFFQSSSTDCYLDDFTVKHVVTIKD